MCWCAWLVVMLQTRLSRAETTLEVELDYAADRNLVACPDETSFRSLVSAELGRDPFRKGVAYRVRAAATAHDVAGVSGTVVWDHGAAGRMSGERTLTGKDCRDTVRAMAFAIAVQIQLLEQQQTGSNRSDSNRGDANRHSSSGDTEARVALPTPEAPPSPEHDVHRAAPANEFVTGLTTAARPRRQTPGNQHAALPPSSAHEARNPAVHSLLWGVGGAVRWRSEPRATPEVRMLLALTHRAALGELSVGGTARQRWGPKDGAGFEFWSLWGSGAACLSPTPLLGCVTGRLERIAARGTGVDVSRDAAAWLVELGPRVGVWGSLSSTFRALLYLEARATVAPARVWLDGDQIWKTPAWSFTLGVDVAARWSPVSGDP